VSEQEGEGVLLVTAANHDCPKHSWATARACGHVLLPVTSMSTWSCRQTDIHTASCDVLLAWKCDELQWMP
jgi:hypothetical protein